MKRLEILIGKEEVEVESVKDFPLVLNYRLEDKDNFQTKTADTAYNVTIPYTLKNSRIANNYDNPSVEDNTPGQIHRNQKSLQVIANGQCIIEGKAFLQDSNEKGYEYSFYGGNGDWIVDLKGTTLYDFLKSITFLFTKENMVNSWAFDGTDMTKPYVFAPVRYRGLMDGINETDANVETTYLRPSISVYYIIWAAFKSLGYRVQSDFLDSELFRRLTMPWTWGNFLDSDGTKLTNHMFLAKTEGDDIWFEDFNGFPDLNVTNDYHDGGFDNNDDYKYVPITSSPPGLKAMEWRYNTPHFGILEATLSSQIYYNCTLVGSNSFVYFQINWLHIRPGTPSDVIIAQRSQIILQEFGKDLGRKDFVAVKTVYETFTDVRPGDYIQASYILDIQKGTGIGARANIVLNELAFRMEYFRIPLGGTISFDNYTAFKNYSFLDFLGGIADTFDLSFNTNTRDKVVCIEPTHGKSGVGGYFNGQTVDWTDKKDAARKWTINLYSDFERNLMFKFKPDGADGIVKTLQDRNSNILCAAKYVLPRRFKAETKEIVNRFFSPVVHWNNTDMKDVTDVPPQFICIIPENISNTSNREAASTFAPKLTYYKGLTLDVGGWRYDGEELTELPYMFAVNYKQDGMGDPILSYCDEKTEDGSIVKGLLKTYFWPRLAIMRNGQFVNAAYMQINNKDVSRQGHREYKIIDGNKYELIEISGYSPLVDKSTLCKMRKWAPVTEEDANNTYPSHDAYEVPPVPLSNEDVKYVQALCLASDIPK